MIKSAHIDKLARVLNISRDRAEDYAARFPAQTQSVVETSPDNVLRPALASFDDFPCVYRGDVVESRNCRVCGDPDRTEDIARCNLNGLCAMRTHGRLFSDVTSCFSCLDQTETDVFHHNSPGP